MTVIMPDDNFFLNSQSFIFIILLIVILQLRERKMKLWKLLIMPVLLSTITIPIIYSEMYSAFNISVIIIGLLAGIFTGFLISKFFEVKVHEDGSMILKGSYIAVLVWIAIILIKIYGKGLLTGYVEINLLMSLFVTITLGTMISRRLFVYWRYLELKKTFEPHEILFKN